MLHTLRPRLNCRRFADDTFKRIFLNEKARISIKISLKFNPKGPINNIPALVQIMAWRRSGDKQLSEPMMVSLLTHICVTRPQWVKQRVVCQNIYILQTCKMLMMPSITIFYILILIISFYIIRYIIRYIITISFNSQAIFFISYGINKNTRPSWSLSNIQGVLLSEQACLKYHFGDLCYTCIHIHWFHQY